MPLSATCCGDTTGTRTRAKSRNWNLSLFALVVAGSGIGVEHVNAASLEVRAVPDVAQIIITGDSLYEASIGELQVEDLPSGRYYVDVAKLGFLPKSQAVDLSAGQSRELTVSLQEEPNFESNYDAVSISRCNPRYFAGNDGKAKFLAGSHTWNNVVDMDDKFPPRRLDYENYLRFLNVHHHNVTRLWAWELPAPMSARYEERQRAYPMPWLRTGPGTDALGLPKFDLEKKNELYYSRLRTRVRAAADSGIVVVVMLFEGWGAQFSPGVSSHPFNTGNNVNGVEFDTAPQSIHEHPIPEILEIQRQHVRWVLEALTGLENVIFEIVNEASPSSVRWQYAMVEYVRSIDDHKRPVGMTIPIGGLNDTLMDSTADWVSPGWESGGYHRDPAAGSGAKAIIVDTDHLGGSAFGDSSWVWRVFTRGHNALFMDRYVQPDSVSDRGYARGVEVRFALGMARLVSEAVPLCELEPRTDISPDGFALLGPSAAVVYEAAPGNTFIDIRSLDGPAHLDWIDPVTGRVKHVGVVDINRRTMYRLPFTAGGSIGVFRTGEVACLADSLEPEILALHRSAETFSRDRFVTLRKWISRVIPQVSYRHILFGILLGIVIGVVATTACHFLIRRKREW